MRALIPAAFIAGLVVGLALGLGAVAHAQSPDNYGPPQDPHHVVLVVTVFTGEEFLAGEYAPGGKQEPEVWASLQKCEQDKLAAINDMADFAKQHGGAFIGAACFDGTEFAHPSKPA